MAIKKKPVEERYSIHVWVNDRLGQAFEEALQRSVPRVSKTALVEALLVQYLTEQGLWPPDGKSRKPIGS